VIETDDVVPDVIVSIENPFPFEDASFDRAYVGHVLEHMPWNEVPGWLDKLTKVLSPSAEVMFVGPDAYRAIEGYRLGRTKWEEMLAIIENVTSYHGGEERWDEDRHFLPELGDWPVVSQARCQFAVSANPPHFTV